MGDVGLRAVFSSGEFRALWASGLTSKVGDVLARVAVTVLAYERTGSAAVTAFTYAMTLLPSLVGGPLLSGLADRWPRRRVMVATDLVRMVLIVCALPSHVPFAVVCGLVFAAQFLSPADRAARIATTPQVLDGAAYPLGVAVNQMSGQLANLAGFAAGGVVVAAIGPRLSLAVDAAAFAVSALIVRAGVRYRAAAAAGGPRAVPGKAAVRLIAADPRLAALVGLAALAGFYMAPEALAVPYAADIGAGTAAVGLLYAAMPVGGVVGMLVFTRLVPAGPRLRVTGVLAVLTSVPLLGCALRPGLVATLALWTVSGLFTAYQTSANAEFVRIVPDELRGQATGVAASALTAAQGLGMVLAGLTARPMTPPFAVALFGALGVAAGIPLALTWRRCHRAPIASPTPA
ncbi:MFS transporter [Actinomadura darangshiensis]|nr:MFS transporter [Actinomadura darangshiensis]